MNHLTLDQQRAKDSLEKVMAIRKNITRDPELMQKADDYASYVVSLPADIRMNGLGQALAQLLAAVKDQSDDPHYWLYRDLQTWLCRHDPLAPYPTTKEQDLLQSIVSHDRIRYQQAISETMAWLKWHAKISVAQLKITGGINDERE
ncbi:CRISPR/Cas system CMR-associated protein Cmr5, small subunit [Seinonella peptonophila]|uniref:CRISPR type III-B/RAMP module-associated protein Cmr5 n=1 Tax=Seinonella peptonophila TaxID=112248 RepID=A0A1M5A169_9BACL|nr:type III-B CRISPR module-associated protein Cmr5 [Seinonella peptonophila]SHF24080.1 CRISPR/Cas system CMR-associated protein Cmr5, small subunit [Seinonella peptonophila]